MLVLHLSANLFFSKYYVCYELQPVLFCCLKKYKVYKSIFFISFFWPLLNIKILSLQLLSVSKHVSHSATMKPRSQEKYFCFVRKHLNVREPLSLCAFFPSLCCVIRALVLTWGTLSFRVHSKVRLELCSPLYWILWEPVCNGIQRWTFFKILFSEKVFCHLSFLHAII